MQKSRIANTDLRAARILAGLKQDEAALLMSVHRGTFNGWERGWRPLPDVKFAKFLKATGITRQDITEYFARLPKVLEYDDRGFPKHAKYGHKQWAANEDEDFDDGLAALEGAEYPQREARREMLRRGYVGEALERAIEDYLLA